MRCRRPLWRRLLLVVITGVTAVTPVTGRAAATRGAAAAAGDPSQYVNPFVGTDAFAYTFPGAAVPFGMVQWSPDTSSWSPGGYLYTDSTIRGFSLTHLSGPGCSIYQDIPFMPTLGPVSTSPATDTTHYASAFSHAGEEASPGYYGVRLTSGITVGLSVTSRTGFGTFTYPASTQAQMLIPAGGSVNGDAAASVQIVGDDEVLGEASSGRFCGYAAPYTVYFVAQFNRPFSVSGTWSDMSVTPGSTASAGPHAGAYVTFDTTRNPVVQMKVGISFVSAHNALLNLEAEDAGWDANAVRTDARAAWNAALSRVEVTGGTHDQEQTFYTALYHTLLHPNVFSDVNGQYIGFDDQVHSAVYTDTLGAMQSYTQYANYSGWDIYRTEIPLLALLFPQQTGDMMQSLVADAAQSGWLPKWAVANNHTGVMAGDPADPIIAGAYAFGATRFDTSAALQAMIKGATQPDSGPDGYLERPWLGDYLSYGYLPSDHDGQWPVAQTLEYAIADFATAQFAQALGNTTASTTLMKQAQNWQNLFNPATGYIQPRVSDGAFVLPFDPAQTGGYIEGNAAQYTWLVPQNLHSLVNAMGGPRQVALRLDAFFTQLQSGPTLPYAWMGNEQDLEVPWEYDFIGQPWKTQAVVRRIMTELYAPDPAGLPGNDDLGTMSAWYVWAALGLYPFIPGVGGLVVGSPLFPHVTVHLTNGHDVVIDAPAATSAMPYVQSLDVDGQAVTQPWLPIETIMNGATLTFALTNTPNMAWGSRPADSPPSFSAQEAPAIGFTEPDGAITVTAGSSQTFQLGIRNLTDAPLSAQWVATLPAGMQLNASAGTMPVGAATTQERTLVLTATTAPGSYLIPFRLQAGAEGQNAVADLPQLVVPVVVEGGTQGQATPTATDQPSSTPTLIPSAIPTLTPSTVPPPSATSAPTPTATSIPPISSPPPTSAPSQSPTSAPSPPPDVLPPPSATMPAPLASPTAIPPGVATAMPPGVATAMPPDALPTSPAPIASPSPSPPPAVVAETPTRLVRSTPTGMVLHAHPSATALARRPTPTSLPLSPATLPLRVGLTRSWTAGGERLAVRVWTASHAQVALTFTLDEPGTRIVPKDAGWKRITYATNFYRLSRRGEATRAGAWTTRLRITYTPRQAMRAGLEVRVTRERSTRVARLTISVLPHAPGPRGHG